jgi:hypothetical protein
VTLNKFDFVSNKSCILHFFSLARAPSVYFIYGDALTNTPHNYVAECMHHRNSNMLAGLPLAVLNDPQLFNMKIAFH